MDRRDFLRALAAFAGSAGLPVAARGADSCENDPRHGEVCHIGVNIGEIDPAIDDDNVRQWCWTAVIASIFRHHGLMVEQPAIARRTFGSIGDVPLPTDLSVFEAIVGEWTGLDGRSFNVGIEPIFDGADESARLAGWDVVDALTAGLPVAFGGASHTKLLERVSYLPHMGGGRIVDYRVGDPWPGQGSRRPSGPQELVPTNAGGDLLYMVGIQVAGG